MSRILKDFLSAAGVAYTNLHADNIFYASPNRRSLLGLKQMLAHYGIATLGVRVSDGDVEDLTFPCILHVKDVFLVATGYEPTHIIYIENGKRMLKSSESLLNEWDGYALLMTEKPTSTCEPDYEKHVHEERMEKIPWWSLAIVMAGILVFGCISQKDYAHSIMSLLSAAGFDSLVGGD